MAQDNFMVLQGEPGTLAQKAAWIIFKEGIEKLLRIQPRVVIGVPGGRSVEPVFRALRALDIEWAKVHIFMVDERLVPVDDEQSNFRLLNEQLGDRVPDGNVHPFPYFPEDHDAAVERYTEELERLGGKLDIVLLSSGEDGHVASLFPGHEEVLNQVEKFVLVDDSPKPPSRRMTATPTLLKRAGIGVLMCIGEQKQEPLNKILSLEGSVEECPARLVREMASYYVLTDREVRLP